MKSDTLPIYELRDRLKRENPDAIILLKVGDFYEAFREDAETCAKVIGLTLTTRGKKGDPNPVSMCGFPYHAVEAYTMKLVDAGYRVALHHSNATVKIG